MRRSEAHRAYNQLPRNQQQAEITRIKHFLDVAEQNDISLRPGYAPDIFVGRENVSKLRVWKRRKIRKVMKAMHEESNHENTEFVEQEKLRQWANTNPSSPIQLFWEAVGHDMLQTPSLIKRNKNGDEQSFLLNNILSIPDDVKEKLDPEAVDRLSKRKEFWNRYGITSGPQLQSSLETNFKRKEVALDERLPVEMKWLKATYPQDFEFLQNLQREHNYKIELIKCSQSPEAVLSSIRDVALASQEKFVSTWLHDFIVNDHAPIMLESDKKLLKETLDLQKIGAERKRQKGKFLIGDLSEVLAEETYERLMNLDNSLDLVRNFIPLYMSIDVDNEHDDPTTRENIRSKIKSINEKFTAELNKEYALKRLHFDDSGSISKKSLEVLKTTLLVGAGAEILERLLHLPDVAKGIAASSDDVLNELASLYALNAIGISWKELLIKRGKFLLPTLGVAVAMAFTVEKAREINERLAGSQFMTSAVLLSAATIVLSTIYFGKNYNKLAKEGKLRDHFPIVSKNELEEIKNESTESEQLTTENVWNNIEKILRKNGEADGSVTEKRAMFERFAKGKGYQQLIEQLQNPSKADTIKNALKEAIGINPSTLGIAIAAFSAPFIGAAFAPIFLPVPILYAIAGSFEGIVGVSTAVAYKRLWFPYSWRRYVNKKINNFEENKKSNKEVLEESPIQRRG